MREHSLHFTDNGHDITLLPAEISAGSAGFICGLMNDEAVMRALNEVPTDIAVWEADIGGGNESGDEASFIICVGGERAGWLCIRDLMSYTQRVYLKMLAILPEFQGRGIGAAAIGIVTERLAREGYLSFDLHTNKDNTAALKCYKKCGFEIIGSVTQKMSDGALVPRYFMRRTTYPDAAIYIAGRDRLK